MRSDMAKVIVERPRSGGGGRFPRHHCRNRLHPSEWDSHAFPRKEGMKQPWNDSSFFRKYLNENLAPLRRFLKQSVNRPWNDVWSDICANLRLDSAVQKHVRDHVWDYVELNVRMVDGCPYSFGFRGWQPLESWGWVRLFVHPESGLLCEAPKRVRRKRKKRLSEPPIVRVCLKGLVQYHLIHDIWYELILKRLRPEHFDGMDATWRTIVNVDDALMSGTQQLDAYMSRYGGELYAETKRQINSRKLRRLVKDGVLWFPGCKDLGKKKTAKRKRPIDDEIAKRFDNERTQVIDVESTVIGPRFQVAMEFWINGG